MKDGIIPKVIVSSKARERIAAGHLWIYRSDIHSADGVQSGQIVHVTDRRRLLGSAFYSSTSQIALRMLTFDDTQIGRDLFRQRLMTAAELRRKIALETTTYRLVNGEADLLPSFIVDRYADYIVIQLLSQGTDSLRNLLVELLEELFQPKCIVERSDARVRELEGLPLRAEVLKGSLPEELVVELNGIKFKVDLLRGQKTGLFLDQRENYLAASQYARGRCLDCFTFAGGFALHLAQRAESVLAIDISPTAIQLATENARLNGLQHICFEVANVFDRLKQMDEASETFDTVVLDPPAFAKSKLAVENAIRGYKEINLRAMKILRPGGILITCSCSYNVDEATFLQVLRSAAEDSGRKFQLLEQRRQARDHTVLLQMPETYYLKCMILRMLA